MTELEAALPAQLVDLKRTRASTCVGLLVGLAFVLLSGNLKASGDGHKTPDGLATGPTGLGISARGWRRLSYVHQETI